MRRAAGDSVRAGQCDGCDWWSQDGSGIPAAVEPARKSDVSIVAAGTRSVWPGRGAKGKNVTSGEGFDLSSLELPGKQSELPRAVKATGKPVVVVPVTGKPPVMTRAKEHADAAVLQSHGGEQQGNAMADVLSGNVNPSGRGNVSFPRSTGNTPCHYNYYPSDREQWFDRGGSLEEPDGHHVFEKPGASWNSGHGLSHTDFEYAGVRLNDTVFSREGGPLRVTLKVRNTGRRDGKEVVQPYVRDKISSVVMPVQQLKAFRKVEVPAGGEAEVRLEVPVEELAFHDECLRRVVEPGEFEIQVGHASDDIVYRRTVVVE